MAFWKFDELGAVLKYDAWIPNLNNWVQATTATSVSNSQDQMKSIQLLCAVAQLRCTGPNTQWESVEECVSVLSQKPFGDYDEAWGDNIVCRNIHIVLTQVRPDVSLAFRLRYFSPPLHWKSRLLITFKQVHCPHVGPTGGGKCVDVPYPNNYFMDESLYGDPLGKTFTCGK